MKISKNTIDVLKNYATINPSVLVKAGNVISTMSPQKTILSYGELEETFPENFAIYELSRFLGVISLFEEPDFDFHSDRVIISGGSHSVTYRYAEPSMIITPPEKELRLPDDGMVSVNLTWADFTKMMRGASILQKPEVRFSVAGGEIVMGAIDTKDMSGDSYSITLADSDAAEGNFVFKIENLKLIEGDYEVKLSPQGLAQFTNIERNMTYFIALQAN